MRILIAEDDITSRTVLSAVLQKNGHEPVEARDGAEALATLLREDAPRMAILDWMMPEMDGLECARLLRSQMPPEQWPKMVIVTARDPEDLPDHTGIEEVLAKPVTPSTLLETLLRVHGHVVPVRTHRTLRNEELRALMESLRGTHLLLAEDNELNQELAVDLLAEADITTRIANNGQEALDWLGKEAFDGVLMDLQMPVMDGYAATQAIRTSQWAHLPVIAMTANVMAGDREKAIAAGLNDQIGKPLDVAQMFATIAKWIHPKVRKQASLVALVPASAPPATGSGVDALPVSLPGIDLEAGLRLSNGNRATYSKLLRLFYQAQQGFSTDFCSALQVQDWPTATRLAHTLKSVSGTVGAGALSEAAKELEKACREQQPVVQVEQFLREVVARLEPVLEGLAILAAPLATVATAHIDCELLRAMLLQLRELLSSGNTEALDLMEELQKSVDVSDQHLGTLEKKVRVFDFQGACDVLDEWVADLELTRKL